jgi:hypothetical protein
MMRVTKFAFSTVAVVATIVANTTSARSVTINQALDVLAAPPAGEPIILPSQLGILTLPYLSPVTTRASLPDTFNGLNDTAVLGDIVFRLLSPDAQYGTVTSNLYTVTLSENNKVATFTGARVNVGEVLRFDRTISDDSSFDFIFSLSPANETNTAAVPEPTTMVGLALAGAAGAYVRRRRQQATK